MSKVQKATKFEFIFHFVLTFSQYFNCKRSSDPDQSSILEYFVKRHLFAVFFFFVSRFVDLITDVIISKTFVNRQERYLDLLICRVNEAELKAHVSRGRLNRGESTEFYNQHSGLVP